MSPPCRATVCMGARAGAAGAGSGAAVAGASLVASSGGGVMVKSALAVRGTGGIALGCRVEPAAKGWSSGEVAFRLMATVRAGAADDVGG